MRPMTSVGSVSYSAAGETAGEEVVVRDVALGDFLWHFMTLMDGELGGPKRRDESGRRGMLVVGEIRLGDADKNNSSSSWERDSSSALSAGTLTERPLLCAII